MRQKKLLISDGSGTSHLGQDSAVVRFLSERLPLSTERAFISVHGKGGDYCISVLAAMNDRKAGMNDRKA